MENIRIEELDNGYYVLRYKEYYLLKEERPIIWYLYDRISAEYTTEQFARNDIMSFKRYVTQEFNGDYEKFETKNNLIKKEVL